MGTYKRYVVMRGSSLAFASEGMEEQGSASIVEGMLAAGSFVASVSVGAEHLAGSELALSRC